MSEENKAVLRKLAEEFNKRNNQGFKDVYAPNAAYHGTGDMANADREAVTQFISAFWSAFPDAKVVVDDLLADGDKVIYRMTVRGTHMGELMGIPATNKAVVVRAIGIARVSGGRIVEEWENFDEMGMMQQIGVIPSQG